MRVCGECAWYEYEKEEPDYGDCMCPLPMSASSEDGYDVDFNSDANGCPCFKARVSDCQHCDGEGFVYPLVDGKVGHWTPCPACHGKEGKE